MYITRHLGVDKSKLSIVLIFFCTSIKFDYLMKSIFILSYCSNLNLL